MSDHIYSTKKAYVLIGDTNNGKTSTINTMISCLTNQSINLYTKNSINASKCITILHFTKIESKYKIKYGNDINEFTNIELLETKYNNVIGSLTDYLDKYVHIYIPINFEQLYGYVFIDIIGKTSNNIDLYDEQLNKINLDYPNNVKIYITKTLSIDMCSKYDNILLTHADKINYTENKTDLEIHKSIISISRNKVNYVTNIDEKVKIMYDTNSIIYNKYNIVHYINSLINQFRSVNSIPLNQFYNHMIEYDYIDNQKLFQEIRKFNSYKLLNASKEIFKSFISTSKIQEKILKFNNNITFMRNHYKCYQKDGSGQKANEFLTSSKLKLFGKNYENESNKFVCTKYLEDNKLKYKKNIKILDNIINGFNKMDENNDINKITKKRPFIEI